MSRRHHGRARHARAGIDQSFSAAPERRPEEPIERARPSVGGDPVRPPSHDPVATAAVQGAPFTALERGRASNGSNGSHNEPARSTTGQAGMPNGGPQPDPGGQRLGCTAPQLRRFIKSRPYVPMHELRRRFGINGAEDDVTPLPLDDGRVYVGLPERECRLLGELVRGGEVGFELSLDPRTPIVVGVYPMRPVPRA